ncbi:D-alanine--D-alanine ligase [Folsomia candida]|uniref:D-alanine--D-alanine ligase n=1 Tax=Folsomia candida TaxID=158441 RepID=A0A226ED36_FOLCA|nr:D-alanine--D-alanine ligase [Folsomia candida]
MLSTYVELLLILQNVYFDHFPLLYKLPFVIRRVQGKGIRVAKVTRRFDLVVSLFPGFVFAAAVFLLIVAILLRFPWCAIRWGIRQFWRGCCSASSAFAASSSTRC